jgi:hypothetical protein
MVVLSLCAALALLAIALVVVSALPRRLDEITRLQRRIQAGCDEQRLMRDLRVQIATGQALAENVVEGGTAAVRTIHKSIASIPFGILESIPATRDTTRVVRRIHDAISDGVYGGIAVTNKALHEAARSAAKLPKPGARAGDENPAPEAPPSPTPPKDPR